MSKSALKNKLTRSGTQVPLLVLDGDPTKARPFLKWAGGKSQLIPTISRLLPRRYNNYFEPMVGSGALFFYLKPPKATLIDTNEELVNCFNVVKRRVNSLVEELQKHRYEESYYYRIRDIDKTPEFLEWNPVQRAARLIYLNKSCFNGLYRVNSSGHFNVPFGRYTNPRICDRGNLQACSRALNNAAILHDSYEYVLKKAKRGDFVYFDPPYVPLSETSNFTTYSKDGFTLEDQEKVAKTCIELDKRGVNFLLSNSHTQFVVKLFKGFDLHIVEATRAINSKADKRGKVQEVLVRNYK